MEFLAATKEGLFIYDAASVEETFDESGNYATGRCADGVRVKMVASLPSPPNAFGHTWSNDGSLLASVSDEGVAVYDATKSYAKFLDIEKVAPDVGGRVGGVRSIRFSPQLQYMVTYEKWDPQFPENAHVWAIKGDKAGTKLHSCTLKGYTSGALPVEIMAWTPDESHCLEMVAGKGVQVCDGDALGKDPEYKLIPEPATANFVISPAPQKGACYVACFIPESVTVAKVVVYHLSNPSKSVMELTLPKKIKECQMLWNNEGSHLLVNAASDVDETGNSYFGSTYLYWLQPDGKKQTQVCGAQDGQVQDVTWSPTANEFIVIVGMLPAKVALYNGGTGKLVKDLGNSKRNTLKWNPFGRFIAVAGFGTLPGDLDFYDRSKDETLASLRAALTVNCCWSNDGRHFLCATVAPRMNEGNQITIYKYNGERLLHIPYVPDVIEGRHEDTGAGARTKTQALLYAASWRPDTPGKHEDRPASPARAGTKRTKGLPTAAAAAAGAPTQAYRPRGAEGGSGFSAVAAMMRGEIDVPVNNAPRERDGPTGWEVKVAPVLEEWEIRKLEKEAKKLAEQKALEAKEKEKQAIRDMEQAEKDTKKKLKQLKAELEELEKLKDKAWDELTEEDEAALEGEITLRDQIAELEKKG